MSESVVSMKQLLESGVHFGHATRRWNPKMKKYIFTARNGIYIIDLQKTANEIEKAYVALLNIVKDGGKVLFVGTKKQAMESLALGESYFANNGEVDELEVSTIMQVLTDYGATAIERLKFDSLAQSTLKNRYYAGWRWQ